MTSVVRNAVMSNVKLNRLQLIIMKDGDGVHDFAQMLFCKN